MTNKAQIPQMSSDFRDDLRGFGTGCAIGEISAPHEGQILLSFSIDAPHLSQVCADTNNPPRILV
jgi:hypothetical protein